LILLIVLRLKGDSEMADIIRQLEQCQDPFTDGNGRSPFIYLSVAQLAREFGYI